MSECYNTLEYIWDNINRQIGCSFDTLNELNNEGKIEKIFNDFKIDELLKKELNDFINLLYTKIYNDFPYLRKLILNESSFIQIFNRFSYIIGLYCGNKDVYRKLPLYLKTLLEKLDVYYYKDLSLEEIDKTLRDRMSLMYRYDPNSDRNLIELNYKPKNFYTDYNLYQDKITNNKLNILNQTEFFIWSEKNTFENEYNELSKYPEYTTGVVVRWVSKEHGDGYGYDVLSYDPILRRQKLIEVKSGRSKNINLTFTEFKEINEAVKNNCDYYVYKYYLDEKNSLFLNKLKYDVINDVFIDTSTNEVYHLSPYFEEQNMYKIKVALEEEKVYKKI